MTTLSIPQRKLILLRQMLPHTWIGHPVASFMSLIGCKKAADDFHYWTLPRRAKKRVRQSDVRWISDSRLRLWDLVMVPIYSLFDAFGFHRLAARVCLAGPFEICSSLGACVSVYSTTKYCTICGEKLGTDYAGNWRGNHQSQDCYKSPTGKHIPSR